MADPIALLSDKLITPEDLSSFTRRHGGFVSEESTLNNRISEGVYHVWYSVSLKADLEYTIKAVGDKFLELFGQVPQTCIILERSDGQQGLRLAVKVAVALSKEWPMVIDNNRGDLLRPDEA